MSSEAGEGTSTSATPTKEQMDAKAQAQNLVAQGKRNLICHEVPAAVQQFQDACQLLAGEFGDMAKECAEAYFHYGSALLDLARMEQGVLGNALDGVDVDAEDEAGPDEKEQFESTDKVDDEASEKKEGAEEEGGEEGGEEEEEEEGGSQEDGEEGEEDPDDVPNLQLSWEMLELAKVIYSKDESKEAQLKLADTYLKLGEVGLESEQYEQAISDFDSCLTIQKKQLPSSDRAIAETYYQLGLACQLGKQLDKAKESLTGAVACLEEKMEALKKIVEEKPPKSPSQNVEPAESAQREIKEILEILPEIKEKVSDTEDEIKSMETIKMMTKQAMGSVFTTDSASESKTEIGFGSASSSSEKSAEPSKTLDINHLIRKKRKPEEEEKKEEEDLENKKQKQEEVTNGGGDASVNGVSKKTETTSEAVAAT